MFLPYYLTLTQTLQILWSGIVEAITIFLFQHMSGKDSALGEEWLIILIKPGHLYGGC